VIKHPLTADPSIHQWSDGKFYIYGSHDKDNPGKWNMEDYHVFSSENLVDWTDHGVVLHNSQTSWDGPFWAPDAAEKDGKYYLYFPEGNKIGVATSDSPTGPFENPSLIYEMPEGYVQAYDPCILWDDGKAYLIISENDGSGFYPAIFTLKGNMVEIEPGSKVEVKNTNNFHEGPFLWKHNEKYYMLGGGHQAPRYWISDKLNGPYIFKGHIVESTTDFPMNTTAHGSVIKVNNQWYLAYHYEVDGPYKRTTCIDSLFYNEDGSIQLVIPTTKGIDPVLLADNPDLDHNLQLYKQPYLTSNIPVYINSFSPEIIIWNTGKFDEVNIPVHCEIRSGDELIYSDVKTINQIKSFVADTVKFQSWKPADIETYDLLFYSQLSNDEDKSSDTLKTQINVTQFIDDFESDFGNWITNGTWGTDNRKAYNGGNCLVVNPEKNYDNNTNSFTMYKYTFDLTSINDPQLIFWSQTDLKGSDHGYVEISTDNGQNWTKISNNFISFNSTWEQQIISLLDFTDNDNVTIRFHFISDMMFNAIGWFIDDIKIESGSTAINEDNASILVYQYQLYDNYPNPFNPETVIQYSIPKNEQVELKVYNLLGNKIVTLINEYKQASTYSIDFDTTGLAGGIYFYQIMTGNFTATKKMLLIK